MAAARLAVAERAAARLGAAVKIGVDSGVVVVCPLQATLLTEKNDGRRFGAVAVPSSTMLARSPAASMAFHSPGVTFTVAPVCVATPFQEAMIC